MSRASYDAIDYNLRPSKAVERKMLADMFRRVDRAAALRHYRYVGFGSPYFADFALFHRALDIQSMISIEREVDDKVRFEFNRPFAAIDLRFGSSSEVLPDLDWDQRTVAWLDYDDPLDTSMLDDIALCAANLASGSMLIISASAHAGNDPAERLKIVKENLEDNFPPQITVDDLGGWDLAQLYHAVITERINTAIRNRNTGKTQSSRVTYGQVVNFQYADGARMMTTGGIILNGSDEASFRQCAFDEFDFYRSHEDCYRIKLPKLTPKEIQYLDSLLPCAKQIEATEVGIPITQSNKYSEVYRYFPRYVDVEG